MRRLALRAREALRQLAFAAALALLFAVAGCPLKDPVPVEPDYPPGPDFPQAARDAGKG